MAFMQRITGPHCLPNTKSRMTAQFLWELVTGAVLQLQKYLHPMVDFISCTFVRAKL